MLKNTEGAINDGKPGRVDKPLTQIALVVKLNWCF